MRNYSSRREQLRLLALFVPLALVILVMSRLRDPKTADTINAFFAPPAQQAPIKPPLGRELGAERRLVVADSVSPRSPEPFAGIRADLLKTIEDNTYFRTAEKDAWFHFLELMRKDAASTTQSVPVEYAQLVDQPNVYRGKLVTVRGTARQITQEKPAENELDIESYYRVVIQPADGANWPIIVYCLELPQGVSVGDDPSLDVKVTGLFFKKLSYKWRDGLGIAPVIVARAFVPDSITTTVEAEQPGPAGDPSIEAAEADEGQIEAAEMAAVEVSTDGDAAFRKTLALAGWDADRLAKFDDGHPLSDAQRLEALRLLRRVRSLDATTLAGWAKHLPNDYSTMQGDQLGGKLYVLSGRISKVTKRSPPAQFVERLEMPEYFESEIKLDTVRGTVTLLSSRVPRAFLRDETLNEPVIARALFVKWSSEEKPSSAVWLAKEVEWYPRMQIRQGNKFDNATGQQALVQYDPLFGKSLLGDVEMDVGQLDQVQSRGRIRPQEREAFYQLLRAVGQIKPATLLRVARANLPGIVQDWENRTKSDYSARRDALAGEIRRRDKEGRFSVALLFNDPEPQIGRLFVFEGVARRAVRVVVGASDESSSNDIIHRYGIDHYYELEVFTDDSQNYPLIFCVRELPKGFPIGADIRVPVRMAGFFFKNWLYSTRGGGQFDEAADAKSTSPRAQFAPLLIGRAPIVLATGQGGSSAGRFVLGGLFVLALAGIWAAAAWFARDDRRFRERTPAANFALPPGQSLNDLNLPTADVPMTTEVTLPRNESSD